MRTRSPPAKPTRRRPPITGRANSGTTRDPNMQPRHKFVRICSALACVVYLGLTACSSADDDLARFIDDTKKEPGGRVEPLPEVKPYETYTYADSNALAVPAEQPGCGRGGGR